MNYKRRKPKKQTKSCGLCAPHKRSGNSSKFDKPGNGPQIVDWDNFWQDKELDSPNFRPHELVEFMERGYERKHRHD